MRLHKNKHIILIGPMGAGKTTIGSILANKLSCPFYDIDKEIEKSTGATINLIFEIEKEQGFRKRETKMLIELLEKPPAIIATGGGIITTEQNRFLLKKSDTIIIYLKTSVKQQLNRLRKDKQRPLLQSVDKKQKLINLAKQRNPLYHLVATHTLQTGYQSAYKMSLILLNKLDQ